MTATASSVTRRLWTDASLEKLFAQVQPQVIRLWVISLMEAREFKRAIDPELIEPDCLKDARRGGMLR